MAAATRSSPAASRPRWPMQACLISSRVSRTTSSSPCNPGTRRRWKRMGSGSGRRFHETIQIGSLLPQSGMWIKTIHRSYSCTARTMPRFPGCSRGICARK
jgi:hypothetical protein